MDSKRFVLITTDASKRGVFAGTLEAKDGDTVTLTDARNCIYWSEKTRGVFGLAAIGPQPGSRIGPAVPRLEVTGVTSISDCTNKARARWEEEPWT